MFKQYCFLRGEENPEGGGGGGFTTTSTYKVPVLVKKSKPEVETTDDEAPPPAVEVDEDVTTDEQVGHFFISQLQKRSGKIPAQYLGNARKLLTQLTTFVDHAGIDPASVVFLSGYRSEDYNAEIGGASKSQHITASAADIQVTGLTSQDLATKLKEAEGTVKFGGLGLYTGWVHIDVRDGFARWVDTADKGLIGANDEDLATILSLFF